MCNVYSWVQPSRASSARSPSTHKQGSRSMLKHIVLIDKSDDEPARHALSSLRFHTFFACRKGFAKNKQCRIAFRSTCDFAEVNHVPFTCADMISEQRGNDQNKPTHPLQPGSSAAPATVVIVPKLLQLQLRR